jgi:molecular chaperone DnaK
MDFTPLRIRLPFGSEDEFIARYGVHVGRDGFFLATRSPKPPGTQLAFELVLSDGSPLLSGEGVVARTVAGARNGMVVRFLRLDGAGAALVERILAARPAAEPPATDVPAEPPSPAPRTRDSDAPTWPGNPTRTVPPAAEAEPRSPEPTPIQATPSEPTSPSPIQATPPEPIPPEVSPIEATPIEPTPDEPLSAAPPRAEPPRAAPPRAEPPRPEPSRAVPPRAAEPPPPDAPPPREIPLQLRPTPAIGVPRTELPRAEAHVHTAVTPVRGIPALGPEVVAFLSGEASAKTTAEAVTVESTTIEPPVLPPARTEVPDKLFNEPPAAPSASRPAPPTPVVAEAPARHSPTTPMVPDAAPVEPAIAKRPAPLDDVIPLPGPSTVQPIVGPAARSAPAPSALGRETPAPPLESPPEGPGPRAPAATSDAGAVDAGLPAAVLALDVGTTSARMAWVHDGAAHLLSADAEGNTQGLPCRLVRDSHGVLRVQQPGEAEEPLWVDNPATLLGTQVDSSAIRTLVRRWPVPVVADERGEVAFDWAGVTVTAVELVAVLLRSLRAAAERRTGRACTQAVLVVPAAFTVLQRARLREAAERAGLTVLRLLNATTAAALAFAHDKGMARRRVLVWRMGAATCDAAVVAISGNDLDVVSSGGDGALGGVNFDEQVALALDKTTRSDPARLRLRVAQAERLKQALSTSERGLVPPANDGDPVIEVTRADLELRTAALVERSVLLAQEVLRAAGLKPENIDAVVLAGGMAQLPHVRRAVETAFGKSAEPGTDPLAAPALGAALLGAALSTSAGSGRARSSVVEVLAVPLEAVAPEFGHQRAFERNTRLPAEKTLSLTLPAGQPLEVQIFQGVARAPDPRSFLGLLHAAGVDRAGEWALQLTLDADGLFHAAATPPGGKRRALALQAAPPPAAAVSADVGTDEADPGARLIGGLKRLFGRK